MPLCYSPPRRVLRNYLYGPSRCPTWLNKLAHILGNAQNFHGRRYCLISDVVLEAHWQSRSGDRQAEWLGQNCRRARPQHTQSIKFRITSECHNVLYHIKNSYRLTHQLCRMRIILSGNSTTKILYANSSTPNDHVFWVNGRANSRKIPQV